MVNVETKIKVKRKTYTTELSDSFDDNEDIETIKDLVEQHIDDYCKEHEIDRCDIEVIDMTSDDNQIIKLKGGVKK